MTIIARLPTWRPSAAARLHPPLPRLLCRQLAQGKQVKNTSKQVFSNCTAVPEWISYFHNLIVSFKLIQRMICFSNPPCTDFTLASSSSFFSSLPSFLFFRSIFFFTTNPKPIPSSSLASSPPPPCRFLLLLLDTDMVDMMVNWSIIGSDMPSALGLVSHCCPRCLLVRPRLMDRRMMGLTGKSDFLSFFSRTQKQKRQRWKVVQEDG